MARTSTQSSRPNLPAYAWFGLVLLTATSAGCDQLGANKTTNHKRRAPHAASASASPSASAPSPHASSSPHPPSSPGSEERERRYTLPFAWENSENEPLARTRDYVKEALRDNQEYMKHGPKFFSAFAKAQRPRSTVVACSDSRVQNAAWDISPENDDFTIRNIGNQIAMTQGSVEYGVEHLGTPVLLIVGHTGCGAVKAAMGDKSTLSESIRREVDGIQIPKELVGQTSDSAWSQAVIAHLNAQVRYSLDHFGHYVAEGRLTIIGAVYDFRNDLGKGAGRLSIVNVNGNSEVGRLNAFVAAVTGGKKPATNDEAADLNSTIDMKRSAEQIANSIEAIPGLRPEKRESEHQ